MLNIFTIAPCHFYLLGEAHQRGQCFVATHAAVFTVAPSRRDFDQSDSATLYDITDILVLKPTYDRRINFKGSFDLQLELG